MNGKRGVDVCEKKGVERMEKEGWIYEKRGVNGWKEG